MANGVESVHLVVVHFSKRLPRYVVSNLLYLQSIFPEFPKTLVVSRGTRVKSDSLAGWSVYEYDRNEETQALFSTGKLDPSFREGFWYVTLERLLALEEVHLRFPDEPLLHVESDVILMPTFPTWFFTRLKALAWQKIDSDEDVASLVFSPSAAQTTLLCQSIRASFRVDPALSDMRALRKFASEHPDQVFYLEMNPETAGSEGIFDPATAGVYLLGNDPRNAKGVERYGQKLSSKHLMPVEDFEWQVTKNSISCRTSGTQWVELHSLHIHSKRPSFFSLPHLTAQATRVADGRSQARFSVLAFFAWIRDVTKDIFRVSSIRKLFKRASGLIGMKR